MPMRLGLAIQVLTGLLAGLVCATPVAAQGFRLLMIEQESCVYCRIFNRDVAPVYALAPEGRAAPLVHADLRGPWPEGVTLASRPAVTPTFILIGPDGIERDRLMGYPGDDFFWGYLARMFDRAGVVIPPPEPAPGND
jgi:hypothetical protein